MIAPNMKQGFDVAKNYNLSWNPHYDFKDQNNLKEIKKQSEYDISQDTDEYVSGEDIPPASWGTNHVYLALNLKKEGLANTHWADLPENVKNVFSMFFDGVEGTSGEKEWEAILERASDEFGYDVCVKDITVYPGQMLSLQGHVGRKEKWFAKEGILSAIADGEFYKRQTGEFIELPKGCVHCMINEDPMPVRVIEIQTGINREKDNKRFVDFNGRATVPFETKLQYESGLLYARKQDEIHARYNTGKKANPALVVA